MDKILVLDFGGQYDQLIARRVREQHVYAEIVPYNRITISDIKNSEYIGIIFTGGPISVYEKNSPKIDSEILNIDIPILGICYGAQLMTYLANGKVSSNDEYREYGKIVFHKKDRRKETVWCPVPSGSLTYRIWQADLCQLSVQNL